MIIISVTVILGLALSGITLNTRKQLNTTEAHNKATDLAEMGITYYLSVNNSLIKPAQDAASANISTNFCTEFTNRLKDASSNEYYLKKNVDDQNSYQIKFDNSTPCTSNLKTIDINFESTGMYGSETPVKLTGSFRLVNNTRSGEPAPFLDFFLQGILNIPPFSIIDNLVIKGDTPPIDNPAFFNSLTLLGKGTCIINNDAYIRNSISLNGQTNLTINGDAIFGNNDPIDKKTNKADICIKGNTYYVSKEGQLVDLDISAFNSCADTNTQKKWSIDPTSGVTVTYPK